MADTPTTANLDVQNLPLGKARRRVARHLGPVLLALGLFACILAGPLGGMKRVTDREPGGLTVVQVERSDEIEMADVPGGGLEPIDSTTLANVDAGVAEVELVEPLHPMEDRPAAEHRLPGSRQVVLMEVTAYCPCEICCGKGAKGITASGKPVSYNGGKFVAADPSLLPYGTKLTIPGYGNEEAVEVIDRGGAIKGHRLDVFFPTHRQARQWGRQILPVVIEE